MQNKPIDVARLGVMRCVIAPEARTTQDGELRRDREGQVQWVTALSVRQLESRRADVINVVVSGAQPTGVAEGAEVRVTNLWANEWAIDGRSGTSWRADAITPVPPAATSGSDLMPATSGSRGKAGEK
ncbi:hypothetical protein [Streptomyces lasiicapitis]|uniref:Head-tail adaptor protein n=1 Tax=Streptomyces lasiicapitis TaxID=1923961 RepID=A0ABQ2LIM9_9ACTN|nr:hypothetical protein [Streptomyces lasiicapitis]GGO35651.1 hypothetical protein GCM10012286_06670 [Streptomyces lasiicapitis]